MDDAAAFGLVREALRLSAVLALPIVGAIAIAGLVAGAVQSLTRVHDVAIGHLARVAAGVVAVLIAGPSIGGLLVAFFGHALALATSAQ